MSRRSGLWLFFWGAVGLWSLTGCNAPAGRDHGDRDAAASVHVHLSPDPELAEAERSAIAQLSDFRKALTPAAPGTQDFEVWAILRDGAASEPLWLTDVRATPDGFDGKVRTQPEVLKSLQRGQLAHVSDQDVLDWSYYERGKLRGARTRAIIAHQKLQAELAEALPRCAEPRFADGCASLADRYATGRIGEKREDVGLDLYVRACNGGSAYGCNAAAWATLLGRGRERDLPAAAALFERACTTGDEHPFACDSRGFALLSGLAGTKRDIPLALRFLDKTCTRGLAPSCLLLELAKAKGLRSGPKRPFACDVNFAELDSRCTGDGDPEACFLQGSTVETGVCGVPKSSVRAKELLSLAAKLGATWPMKADVAQGTGS